MVGRGTCEKTPGPKKVEKDGKKDEIKTKERRKKDGQRTKRMKKSKRKKVLASRVLTALPDQDEKNPYQGLTRSGEYSAGTNMAIY
jgi:hypothetical protein